MPDEKPPRESSAPQLILLTGLSGAGKSTASKALEDAGFFCIDNLPAVLLPDLLEKIAKPSQGNLALVMDTRDPDFLKNYADIFQKLENGAFSFTIIFLEADDLVLLRRYSAMRRRHPASRYSVREGIEQERRQLSPIRELANTIIDTSSMTPHDLRGAMLRQYDQAGQQGLRIGMVSFGFKNGPPVEADLMFDARFLANPYFVAELKEHSGLQKRVADYVLENTVAHEFIDRLISLLRFLIPQYEKEGKTYLTIGIGCTGGHHRSVAVAERLSKILRQDGRSVYINHRDL